MILLFLVLTKKMRGTGENEKRQSKLVAGPSEEECVFCSALD